MTHLSQSGEEYRVGQFMFRFPQPGGLLDQDEEWCQVLIDGHWRRIRFHDYHEIYSIPGLYEALFYKQLKCCSPSRVATLLEDVLTDWPTTPADLRALDLGAGNGMVGEQLRGLEVQAVVGADLISEARDAAMRDRPGVYDDYIVGDITSLDDQEEQRIRDAELNTLSCVAALGYGDIPPQAFIKAANLVDTPGWLAFNIKENFLDDAEDNTGFSGLINRLMRERIIKMQAYRRYRHRFSVQGRPLHYVAVVATKEADIPLELAG